MFEEKIEFLKWLNEKIALDKHAEKISIAFDYILIQTQYPYTLISKLKEVGVESEYFECMDYRMVRIIGGVVI